MEIKIFLLCFLYYFSCKGRIVGADWKRFDGQFVSSKVLRHINVTKEEKTLSGYARVKRDDEGDALSKNITMILEDLLKDYDKTERPAFKTGKTNLYLLYVRHILSHIFPGEATKVKINILIRSMGPISEEDMVRIGGHFI